MGEDDLVWTFQEGERMPAVGDPVYVGIKQIGTCTKVDGQEARFQLDTDALLEAIGRTTDGEIRLELERVTRWKDDLLEGKTVNCVYCGHRYEPGTPASQADVLKKHIEQCPDHPLAHLRNELAAQPSLWAVRTVDGYVAKSTIAHIPTTTTSAELTGACLMAAHEAHREHTQRAGSEMIEFKLWEVVDDD